MTILNVLAIIALLGVGGFTAGKWLFTKDTEMEDRRRTYGKLALALSKVGLVKVPEFLIDLSVGDISGAYQKVKALVELAVSGESAVLNEFEAVFDNLLVAKLKTDAGRALIAAKLSDASKEGDPSVVKDAPIAGVL